MGTAFLNKYSSCSWAACALTLRLPLGFKGVPKEQAQVAKQQEGTLSQFLPWGTKAEPYRQNRGWWCSCGNFCCCQILIWPINNTCSSTVAFHYLHFNVFIKGKTWKVLILQFGKCYYYNHQSLALGQVVRAPLQKVSCWDVWTMAWQTVLACAKKNKLLPSCCTSLSEVSWVIAGFDEEIWHAWDGSRGSPDVCM